MMDGTGRGHRRASGIWHAGWVLGAFILAGCTPTGQMANTIPAPSAQPAGVMNVADAAIAGGDPNMALKVSQSVLADDPKNLDALYHEGAAYYAINRCMDAIAVYKVALTVDANSAPAELGIGRCLLQRNAAEAEAAFAAAVQYDPQNAAALNDLGVARDLQGNHAGAVQPYQKSLLVDPGNTATEVNLGMSLALSGDGADALEYLGPIATGNEATPKIREDYAAALVAAGREDEARQVLEVDLTPDQVNNLIAAFQTAIATAQPAPVAQAAAAAPAAVAPAATAATVPAATAATLPAATGAVVTTPVTATALAATAAPSTPDPAPAPIADAPITDSAPVTPPPPVVIQSTRPNQDAAGDDNVVR